jgi:hypothetical protein
MWSCPPPPSGNGRHAHRRLTRKRARPRPDRAPRLQYRAENWRYPRRFVQKPRNRTPARSSKKATSIVSKLCPLTTGIVASAYRTRRARTASNTEMMKVTWDGGDRFMRSPCSIQSVETASTSGNLAFHKRVVHHPSAP